MPSPVLYFVDDLAEGIALVAEPFHSADPTVGHVNVMDLSVTRGDGIFETAGVNQGLPQALNAHLRRFAHSAAMLDLPAPKLDIWEQAIRTAIAAYGGNSEAFAKFIMTRGLDDGDGTPIGWVYVADAHDFTVKRSNGIGVVILDRGYRHDVARTSPWLLAGAKTLSYAVNKSVLREAARRGADDVIFSSTDGFVLEGPTSSVLLRSGDALITPATDQGILEGTTQGSAFEFAQSQGLTTEYREVRVDELHDADALWLVSSVRCAAPIRALDGQARQIDHEFTDALNAFLLARSV